MPSIIKTKTGHSMYSGIQQDEIRFYFNFVGCACPYLWMAWLAKKKKKTGGWDGMGWMGKRESVWVSSRYFLFFLQIFSWLD